MATTGPVWTILDLVGIFAFAFSGALLAVRREYDFVGGLTLAAFAALGGGITRDVILGRTPVTLERPMYLVPPLLATIVVYLVSERTARQRALLVTSDAAGLALFCSTGAAIALERGMNPVACVLMGTLTATGGGLIRDVVANEPPAAFSASEVYVVPAATGATLAVLAWHLHLWGTGAVVVIGVAVFAFRMVAWRWGWRAPAASRTWRVSDLPPFRPPDDAEDRETRRWRRRR